MNWSRGFRVAQAWAQTSPVGTHQRGIVGSRSPMRSRQTCDNAHFFSRLNIIVQDHLRRGNQGARIFTGASQVKERVDEVVSEPHYEISLFQCRARCDKCRVR